jgi:Flp pilus assembly protein TadB
MCLCSFVFICACVFKTKEQRHTQEENTHTDKNNWTKEHTRGKQTNRLKTTEQKFIRDENTRTDKNKRTKAHTRGKTRTDKNNCFYLCVCFPLVWTFVQLFLSVPVFSSCMYLCSIVFICTCVFLSYEPLFNWNKGSYERKTHAQIKTIEQRYIQEENTGTDKNNWIKVHTRGKHTHR